MTRFKNSNRYDHDTNNERVERHGLRREAKSQVARDELSVTRTVEQCMYVAFVRTHQDAHPFCRSVSDQLRRGKTLSKRQACVLRRISEEEDWPLYIQPMINDSIATSLVVR